MTNEPEQQQWTARWTETIVTSMCGHSEAGLPKRCQNVAVHLSPTGTVLFLPPSFPWIS